LFFIFNIIHVPYTFYCAIAKLFSLLLDLTTRSQRWCVQPSWLHPSASPGGPWSQPLGCLIPQTLTQFSGNKMCMVY